MRLQTIARRLPDEVWSAFEPVLPPVAWEGEGRPPARNHACLHGLLYVLVTGIGWEYVPPCCPSGRTIRRRLAVWRAADAFREAWRRSAERSEALRGVNWDQVLIDGAKTPSEKGAPPPAPAPSIAASAAPPCTERPIGTASSWPRRSPARTRTTASGRRTCSTRGSSTRPRRTGRTRPPTPATGPASAATAGTGTGRAGTGHGRPGSAGWPRPAARPAGRASGASGAPSSGGTPSWPSSAGSPDDSTGTANGIWAGCNWPPPSS